MTRDRAGPSSDPVSDDRRGQPAQTSLGSGFTTTIHTPGRHLLLGLPGPAAWVLVVVPLVLLLAPAVSGDSTGFWGLKFHPLDYLLVGALLLALLATWLRHRRSEAALLERERFLRSLVENSLDLITILDPHGTVVLESPSVRIAFHRPPGTPPVNPVEDVHPEDLASFQEALAKAGSAPGSAHQVTYRRRDSAAPSDSAEPHWLWLEAGIRSFNPTPGKPPVVLINAHDITARMESETQRQALAETMEIRVAERTREISDKNEQLIQEIIARTQAEEELKTLTAAVEQSTNVVMLLGLDRTIAYVNTRFISVIGYPKEEAWLRSPFHWCITPPEPAAIEAIWHQVGDRGSWSDELQLRTGIGTACWVELRISAIRGDNGAVSHYLVNAQDVTARRSAEAERLQLVAVVEQASEAIVITDARGVIQYVNPAFTLVTGWSREEAVGSTPRVLKSGVHPPEFYAQLWATITAGKVWQGRIVNRRKDGTLIHEEGTISPIRDANQAVTTYVAIKRDVTYLVQMEQQLRQAQKLESIGQLAAGIAHEINTPIQFIGDNLRYLSEAYEALGRTTAAHRVLAQGVTAGLDPAPLLEQARAADDAADVDFVLDEVPKALAQSLEGIERVATIVRAMKEFAHPGSASLTLTDLNHAIGNTVTISRNEWKYVAEVTTDLDRSLPLVPVQPGDFNQVILNLIVNAAHAIADAKRSPGRITITTRRILDQVEIRIGDNGTGIPEAVRDRIFDPFFTTKQVGRGTGQGLTLARSMIVERHRGTITFETEAGTGTTFIVRLPLGQTPSELHGVPILRDPIDVKKATDHHG